MGKRVLYLKDYDLTWNKRYLRVTYNRSSDGIFLTRGRMEEA